MIFWIVVYELPISSFDKVPRAPVGRIQCRGRGGGADTASPGGDGAGLLLPLSSGQYHLVLLQNFRDFLTFFLDRPEQS